MNKTTTCTQRPSGPLGRTSASQVRPTQNHLGGPQGNCQLRSQQRPSRPKCSGRATPLSTTHPQGVIRPSGLRTSGSPCTRTRRPQQRQTCPRTSRVVQSTRPRQVTRPASQTKRQVHKKSNIGLRLINLISLLTMATCVIAGVIALASMGTFSKIIEDIHLPVSQGVYSDASNPSVSLAPSPNFFNACNPNTIDNSQGCIQATQSAIDRARKIEGLGPIELPSDFAQLSAPVQLLDVINQERTARGYRRVDHLSSYLTSVSKRGATTNSDPSPSQSWAGNFTANWAGGIPNALAADYMWLYDDGVGSPNVNCQISSDPGCWGHRNAILAHFPKSGSLSFGASLVAESSSGQGYYDSIAMVLGIAS